MAVYCKKCGNQLNENAKFCPKCGTPYDGRPAFGQVPVTPVMNKKKKKPVAAIVISVILVLAVAAAGVWFFLLRDTGSETEKKKNEYKDNFTVGEDVKTTSATTEPVTTTTAPDPDAPTTIYAGNISNPELKKLVEQGKVTSHITGIGRDAMNEIISYATSLEYYEVDEQQFSDELMNLTGCKIDVSDPTAKELAADYDNYYYIESSTPENETYCVIDKIEKSLLIMTRKINSDEGYWVCRKLTDTNAVGDYLNGKAQTSDTEIFYVLDGTGETVFYEKTVDNSWTFYYNDIGELFLGVNSTDTANPEMFNGNYESLNQNEGNNTLKTVLDGIASKYGKELVL